MVDLSPLFTGVVGFILGFGVGYYVRALTTTVEKDLHTQAEDLVMGIIAIAWFLSVVASIMMPSLYQTPLEVHAIMGLLAGYLYKKRSMQKFLRKKGRAW